MERSENRKGMGLQGPSRQRGITMIELMIVIVIVAILGTLAVPSYRDYVVRSNRMEAVNVLLEIAACQERTYIKQNEYDDTRCNVAGGLVTENGFYNLTMAETDGGQGFTLTATPRGTQATSDAACAALVLDHTGARDLNPTKADPIVDACWRGKKVSS